MNFRFFSLVGFVCACAPFGVSSTQEVDICEVTLTNGFFQTFTQDTERALGNLVEAADKFRILGNAYGLDIPRLENERSVFDSLPKSETKGPLTLTGGFFQAHDRDLREVVSLSSRLLQIANRFYKSVNIKDLFAKHLSDPDGASGQGSSQKAGPVLSQILENNQLVCRLFDGCGHQINLSGGTYSPSAYLNKLTQELPTTGTEAKEPRQLLDVIQHQLDAQKELLSMLATSCGVKVSSEAQPDNQ